MAQTAKHPPVMQETRVQYQGQKDPLEKEMVIHSIILGWEIPQTEEPGRLQSMGLQSEVAQSCLTLCDTVDRSLPGFSIHGILQARILEWVTISFSRRNRTLRAKTALSIDRMNMSKYSKSKVKKKMLSSIFSPA